MVIVSLNSNFRVFRFQRARTTSELGEAPSGMNASSSPLSGNVGRRVEERGLAGGVRTGAGVGQQAAEAGARAGLAGALGVLDLAGARCPSRR